MGSAPAQELRWSDQRQTNVVSTAWVATTKPGSNTQMTYLHAYTADNGSTATGDWVPGAVFALSGFNQLRWNNSQAAGGAYASAPILTCYPSTAHGAATPGDGSVLGGHATDTGSSSYIKATAYGYYGILTNSQAPAGAPTGAFPTASDHTAGAVTTASAAWSNGGNKWQDLQDDTHDWIVSGNTSWSGAQNQIWPFMAALFTGPNMTPGLAQPVISLKYTYT